jgi:DnaJ-class molecular chaperone
MSNPLIIYGQDFREKLAELKTEVDARLISGRIDPAPEPLADPTTTVPCPFCGGEGKVNARVNYGHGDCTCEVFVECGSCHGRGPDTGYWGTPTHEQKVKAVELWEKRAIKTIGI